MSTMNEPLRPSAHVMPLRRRAQREVLLRRGLRAATGIAELGAGSGAAGRHRHRWELVAVEQDSFGRVAMRQCQCGLLSFSDAA